VLELEIDAEGVISRARVVEGAEPFAEQARRAALNWRFSPARQGSTAVAARIRARVDFHDAAAGAPSQENPERRPERSESVGASPPRTPSEARRRASTSFDDRARAAT
jgi:TonB family protein